MSVADGMGEDWGSLLSLGLGYIRIVVVPAPSGQVSKAQLKPKIIYVQEKYLISLTQFQILKEYTQGVNLSSLSFEKLNRINILLADLAIRLPSDLQLFLKEIIVALRESKEIPIDKFKMIKRVVETSFENLGEIRYALHGRTVFSINKLALAKRVIESLGIKIQTLRLAWKMMKIFNIRPPRVIKNVLQVLGLQVLDIDLFLLDELFGLFDDLLE